MHDEHMAVNLAHWDELVPIHAKSAFYDVDGFRSGKSSLDEIEREGVGHVAGKSLLHLQCHFGMDTISWARLGATATGVDFSEPAIDLAQSLSRETGVDARFIQANIYDLPDLLDEQFDVVFTSYGVLTWLPDIQGWARVVGRFLKPGGRFFIVDGHPLIGSLDQDHPGELRVRYSYFHAAEPLTFADDGSYADSSAVLTNRETHEWNHPLSDIINSLIDTGLTIERLGEHPVCSWQAFPFLEDAGGGWWQLPDGYPEIPLLFSLRARK